jgi:hypothetical protein
MIHNLFSHPLVRYITIISLVVVVVVVILVKTRKTRKTNEQKIEMFKSSAEHKDYIDQIHKMISEEENIKLRKHFNNYLKISQKYASSEKYHLDFTTNTMNKMNNQQLYISFIQMYKTIGKKYFMTRKEFRFQVEHNYGDLTVIQDHKDYVTLHGGLITLQYPQHSLDVVEWDKLEQVLDLYYPKCNKIPLEELLIVKYRLKEDNIKDLQKVIKKKPTLFNFYGDKKIDKYAKLQQNMKSNKNVLRYDNYIPHNLLYTDEKYNFRTNQTSMSFDYNDNYDLRETDKLDDNLIRIYNKDKNDSINTYHIYETPDEIDKDQTEINNYRMNRVEYEPLPLNYILNDVHRLKMNNTEMDPIENITNDFNKQRLWHL